MTGFDTNPSGRQIQGPVVVECRLFSDKVSEQQCLHRKKELHLKDTPSCSGCQMEDIVNRQLRLMLEVFGIGPLQQ